MPRPMTIDFISDISCPWCAVGLKGLVAAAEKAGLDGQEARTVLASNRYAKEVRQAEELWQVRGIRSVPSIIVDGRYLISGGQPPEAFEQALRQIATEAA